MSTGEPVIKQAAVLVGIVERPAGDQLILTRRSMALLQHAGQISFPGGVVESQDADLTDTALREAHEEVGLNPDQVDVSARLPPYRTGTGFEVTPVIGRVDASAKLSPSFAEVVEIFELPLAAVLQAGAYRCFRHDHKGRQRLLWALPYGPYYIWGATAAIFVRLRRHLLRQSGKYISPQDSLATPSVIRVSTSASLNPASANTSRVD